MGKIEDMRQTTARRSLYGSAGAGVTARGVTGAVNTASNRRAVNSVNEPVNIGVNAGEDVNVLTQRLTDLEIVVAQVQARLVALEGLPPKLAKEAKTKGRPPGYHAQIMRARRAKLRQGNEDT